MSLLDSVLLLDEELGKIYETILKEHKLNEIDLTVRAYEKEIKDTNGSLTNERIRYYLGMFSYYSYMLNASISRHSMKSNIAELLEEVASSKVYMGTSVYRKQDMSEKKFTREERQASARLGSEEEAKATVLLNGVTKAVEGRIWALNRLLDTLNTLSAMNMSEAKLGGK